MNLKKANKDMTQKTTDTRTASEKSITADTDKLMMAAFMLKSRINELIMKAADINKNLDMVSKQLDVANDTIKKIADI